MDTERIKYVDLIETHKQTKTWRAYPSVPPSVSPTEPYYHEDAIVHKQIEIYLRNVHASDFVFANREWRAAALAATLREIAG